MWLRSLRMVGLAGGLLMVCGGLACSAALAQDRCASERAAAENHYLEGRFNEAINQLQACLDRAELDAEEATDVYRLLGLAFMQQGDLIQARLAILNLLSIVPDYEADPIQDPPSYTSLVDLVKEQVQVEQAAEDEPPVAQDEPPAAGEDPPPLVAEPPARQQTERSTWLDRPKNWFVAVGGAVVVAVATALAFGGGSGEAP